MVRALWGIRKVQQDEVLFLLKVSRGGHVKEQRKHIDSYRGGRFNFYQIWTPGETIFISVDAYGQCSSDVFEKFGSDSAVKSAGRMRSEGKDYIVQDGDIILFRFAPSP